MLRTLSDGMPEQRTEKGLLYDEYCKYLRGPKSDKALKSLWERANEAILHVKVSPNAVHHDEILKNLSVMFANDEYIAERVMPTVKTGGKLGGSFWKYDRSDKTNFPDDEIGERGQVNELGSNRSRDHYALTPRSLKEPVDQYTIQNQSEPLNELMDAQSHVMEGMSFNREVRTAGIVSDPTVYNGNTLAIAAGDRFDTATGGDPGGVVDAGRAAVWSGMGPGRWVLAVSLNVYNVLKRNERILDKYKFTSAGGTPQATRRMLADYFEVDEVLVGAARKNTANINQAKNEVRIWPDIMALLRVSKAPSLRNAAFGYIVEDMEVRQDMWFAKEEGGQGVWYTRATRADQEKVVASPCGFLWTTPIG